MDNHDTNGERTAGLIGSAGKLFGKFLKPAIKGSGYMERQVLKKSLNDMAESSKWATPDLAQVSQVSNIASGLAKSLSPQLGRSLVQFKNVQTPGSALSMASNMDEFFTRAAEGLPSTFKLKDRMVAESGALKNHLDELIEVVTQGGAKASVPLRKVMAEPHNFRALNDRDLQSKLQALNQATSKIAQKFVNVERLSQFGRVGLVVSTLLAGNAAVNWIKQQVAHAPTELEKSKDDGNNPVPSGQDFLKDPTYKPSSGSMPGSGLPSTKPYVYQSTPGFVDPPLMKETEKVSPYDAENIILGSSSDRYVLAQRSSGDEFDELLLGLSHALKGAQSKERLHDVIGNLSMTVDQLVQKSDAVTNQAKQRGIDLDSKGSHE